MASKVDSATRIPPEPPKSPSQNPVTTIFKETVPPPSLGEPVKAISGKRPLDSAPFSRSKKSASKSFQEIIPLLEKKDWNSAYEKIKENYESNKLRYNYFSQLIKNIDIEIPLPIDAHLSTTDYRICFFSSLSNCLKNLRMHARQAIIKADELNPNDPLLKAFHRYCKNSVNFR